MPRCSLFALDVDGRPIRVRTLWVCDNETADCQPADSASPDSLCGGFYWENRGVGYELLTRHYGCFYSPVSARRDLHPSGEAGPVAVMRLIWRSAVGVSGNMKNQG